jgi:hypothetical protein
MSPAHLEELRKAICEELQSLQKAFPRAPKAKNVDRPLGPHLRTTRDAARFFAKHLLRADQAGANKLLKKDREGAQAFLLRAIVGVSDINTKLPKACDAIGEKYQLYPFYNLAKYILECFRLDDISARSRRVPTRVEKFVSNEQPSFR